MNPEVFFKHLRSFLEEGTKRISTFTPQTLLELQGALKIHLQLLAEEIGFDPYFHFNVTLSVNPSNRSVRVNLVPLTVIGLEMLMSSGVPVDESLQKQIRQMQDRQIINEILSYRRSEANQPQRGLRDDAGQESEPVREGSLEEQGLASEDSRSSSLPMADSGDSAPLRRVSVGSEISDPGSSGASGDRTDDRVLHSSEGSSSQGPLEVQRS